MAKHRSLILRSEPWVTTPADIVTVIPIGSATIVGEIPTLSGIDYRVYPPAATLAITEYSLDILLPVDITIPIETIAIAGLVPDVITSEHSK